MADRELTLETKEQENTTANVGGLLVTPSINENFWAFRVKLTERQAIVGFPKFHTIGIGFAQEGESWNTNLPYRCPAEEIYEHIECNKGDDSITRDDCLAAIRMVQEAAAAHMASRVRITVADRFGGAPR